MSGVNPETKRGHQRQSECPTRSDPATIARQPCPVIHPSSLRLLHRIQTVTFRAVHIGQIFALTRIGTGLG